MTPLATRLVSTVKDKGWLHISSAFFDNTNVLTVTNSSGYVAVSESENSVFWLTNQDTADSENVFNGFIYSDPTIVAHHVTLVQQDLDCLQHVEYALYSKMNFYWDGQDQFPMPTIPTKAEIMALTKNEETGLYDGASDILYGLKPRYNGFDVDTVLNKERTETSTINMYQDDQFTGTPTGKFDNYKETHKPFYDYPSFPKGIGNTMCAAGVNIDAWQTFYKNQERFVTALQSFLGVSDLA